MLIGNIKLSIFFFFVTKGHKTGDYFRVPPLYMDCGRIQTGNTWYTGLEF